MGLASSQARLLLLTARKSDLEFRAQQITNSEMILAMKTEEVASEYSRKLSNQTIKYIDQNDQTGHDFTAATLSAISEKNGSSMVLQVLQGGKWHTWESNGTNEVTGYTDANGNEISVDEYNALGQDARAAYTAKTVKTAPTNNYSGPEILAGINNGTMRIVTSETADTEDPKVIDAINGDAFSVGYNTADDAAADAEYRSKTASIQIKEKRLQMELNQVETQQKACDTEIDSVKKVMDKNIERTFKVFS